VALDIKGNLKKNKGLWIFVGAALVVAVILGLFVSPFASKSPDGLDKTAEEKGFANKAQPSAHSPMKDYAVPGVANHKASTGLSGLIGVLITAAAAALLALAVYGIGRLGHGKKTPAQGPR
jgi:hypothetical protein